MAIENLITKSEEGSEESFTEVALWMKRNEGCRLWEIELGFYRAVWTYPRATINMTWVMAMKLYIEGV